MRLNIEFYDREGKPTTNYVEGNPMIWIEVAVDAPIPDEQAGKYEVAFAKELALVDTGASHLMVCPELAEGKKSRPTQHPVQTAMGYMPASAYFSLVRIPPFNVPHFTIAGSAPIPGLRAVVGRDILSHYKLVFDIKNKEFYLELS